MNISKKVIIGAIIAGVAIFTAVLVFAFEQPSYKSELPETMPPSASSGENYNHPYSDLPENTPPLAPEEDNTDYPMSSTISRNEAIKIAYNYLDKRGIIATFREDSGIELERGRRVWSLEFRDGETVYEFYIDADTGSIVKFEKEDDR